MRGKTSETAKRIESPLARKFLSNRIWRSKWATLLKLRKGQSRAIATRAGFRRIRDAADQPVPAGREIMERGAGAVAQTANTLADVTRHAANQGEEVVRSGRRTFVEAQPLANASYAHGRRVVDTDVPPLAACYTQLGRGFLQMQQSYFDVLRRSMGVAELQRDLYRNAVTTTIEASRAVLQSAAQVTQSAVQPLQGRG